MKTLAEIQSLIKAPKGQFNSFGKYKYRSAEDILEAVKVVINPLGYWITLTDELIQVGDRYYIKSTATLTDGTNNYHSTAFAREEESKKGMDGSQVTGASSSYARKYALNGLFAIDDTKDSDATNTHDDKAVEPKKIVEAENFDDLHNAYMIVWNEYKAATSTDEATKYHPSRWKTKSASAYNAAIKALNDKLETLKTTI